MNQSLCIFAAGVFALVSAQSALAQAADKPLRHLVYSVSYGATSSITQHTSGFNDDGNGGGGGSGVSTSHGHIGANGELVVEVLREQPDHGLVLTIAESVDNPEHRTKATTCVVYGNTNAICDPNGTIEPEALELVRVLGSNFVDVSLIDAKQHWSLSSTVPDSSLVSDYTITHNAAGVMTIDEERQITYAGAHRGTAHATATIGYDFNRTLPTSIKSLITGRVQAGSDYRDVKTDVTLTLVSDSMAAAH